MRAPPDKEAQGLDKAASALGVAQEEQAVPVAERIREKLIARFSPLVLEVENVSHRHAGHAGARPGGESHFEVRIVAKAFEGLSRMARQRLVYDALADELSGPVHALTVSAKAPGEIGRR